MSIRVMIVEDEDIIRMGIEKVIPWDTMDCEVVARAENGQEGLLLAEQTEPQLVISDIRMPKMDGLSLAEKLSKAYPGIQIILLTGYKEFDYAKKALAYGVKEYLLKPVDTEELKATVRSCVKEIQDRQNRDDEWVSMRKHVEESLPILRNQFIQGLLFFGSESIYHIYEKLEFFNIRIQEFSVLAFELDSFYELEKTFREEDVQILFFLMEHCITELEEAFGYRTITFHHDKTVYALVSGETHSLQNEELMEFANDVCEKIEHDRRISVSAGISNIYEGAENVRNARIEGDRCLAKGHAIGNRTVICYNDLLTEQQTGTQPAGEVDREAYYRALTKGEDLNAAMAELRLRLNQLRDIQRGREITLEVVSRTFSYITGEYEADEKLRNEFVNVMERACAAKNQQSLDRCLEETARQCQTFIDERLNTGMKTIIDLAVSYMKENCSRELKLEEVAEQVYISKWYFSKLFRKEMGVGFTDYANRLRIEESQRLMREQPYLKNYEIAEMLDFGNVRYFSQVFKKVTGMTPSEYRGT